MTGKYIRTDTETINYLKASEAQFRKKWQSPRRSSAKLQDFQLMKSLGKGAFGFVFLAWYRGTDKFTALKIQDKQQIVHQKQDERVVAEKLILQSVDSPFVVKLYDHFQDNSYLYLVMEYMIGGDLFGYLYKAQNNCFSESLSKFYAAQLVLAFEYLHHLKIVYRDLKPENVMIDRNGYIKLTDFGAAKIVNGRTYTLVGTPQYLAPEIIQHRGYNKAVDWWTLGILLYEMNAGIVPFNGDNDEQIVNKILVGKVRYPRRFSSDLRDLLRNLLHINLTRRFGNLRNGVNDIKEHKWFQSINWMALLQKKLTAPSVPKIKIDPRANISSSCIDEPLKISPVDLYADKFVDF